MRTVLVTGGKGQLAACIKDVSNTLENTQFIYADLPEFDITNKEQASLFFAENNIDYCINCAAYTAVDKAESEANIAHNVNVTGVQNLIKGCQKKGTTLIHISTDFVFSGNTQKLYIETDPADPISIYGRTKLDGEEVVQSFMENYFILRTSWLYSEYGNNFMKTMIRLGKEKEELGVINDQIGTPTYAKDLAQVVLKIIKTESRQYGLYHYSNEGAVSWYDFAKEIFLQENIKVDLNPIPTSAYPTPAKRPKYSVLDKSKIKENLQIQIPDWKNSLKMALKAYRKL